jgi:hypothetical protein
VKIKSTGASNTDYNMGGKNDGIGAYTHSSGGKVGADGIYTIELDLPLRAATGDIYDSPGGITRIEIFYIEQTKLVTPGTENYEQSAMWRSGLVSIQIPKPEYVSNGGFETDRTDGEWGFKDWETLGTVSSSSGYIGKGVFPIQDRYGGDAAQKIYFNNFPMKLSFWMKPQPTGEYVRLQVQIDRTTILYDKNFTGPNNNYQWTEVVLQFTPTEGIHEIRFYVLPGPDYYPKDSSSVGIDEVSITILSSPTN